MVYTKTVARCIISVNTTLTRKVIITIQTAIFGGTFDPPTLAHEAIIKASLQHDLIDEVWVMPSGLRTDKVGMQPDEIRLNMLEAVHKQVFDGSARVIISDFELGLPRPTQTWETNQALKNTFPDRTFWYIFGADSYTSMGEWEHGLELKHTLHMLVVPRRGFDLPPASTNIQYLVTKEVESVVKANLSSSKVRAALKRGESIDNFVSPCITSLITANKLYSC